jgi:hypothetical protein
LCVAAWERNDGTLPADCKTVPANISGRCPRHFLTYCEACGWT